MKTVRIILVLVVLSVCAFAAGYWTSSKGMTPTVEVIDSTTMLEVYQELPVNSVKEIHLKGVNVNVKISKSDSQYIRVIYQPETDKKTFHYTINDGIMELEAESLQYSPQFLPRQTEVIRIYLPKQSNVIVVNETESGYFDMEQVRVADLTVSSKEGFVSLHNVEVTNTLTVNTTGGNVYMENAKVSSLNTASGSLNAKWNQPLSAYSFAVSTVKGHIFINNEQVDCGTVQRDDCPILILSTGSADLRLHFAKEEEE